MKETKHLQINTVAQQHLEALQKLTGSSQAAIVEQALAFYHLSFNPAAAHQLNLTSNALPASRQSKYQKLADHLSSMEEERVTLTFTDIETIVGTALPDSARTHRAWWANSGQPQSRVWVDAGWKVEQVNFEEQSVQFKTHP